MTNYLLWYWRRYGAVESAYASFEEFEQAVGPHPGADYKLARIDRKRPANADNLVWYTDVALDLAKEGTLEIPSTPQHPQNASKFAYWVRPTIEAAKRRQSWEERYQELDQAVRAIYDKVLTKLANAGLDASAWRDPEYLSDSRFMNEARERLTKAEKAVQDHLDNRGRWLEDPERPRYRGGRPGARPPKPVTEEQEWDKLINAANRVHTGKPGRPKNRFKAVRRVIADMSMEEKRQLGIPPTAKRLQSHGPSGQLSWRRVVTVYVDCDNPSNIRLSPLVGKWG